MLIKACIHAFITLIEPTRNAVVAAGKKAILLFFQQPLPHFLHSRGQSVVILNKLEIYPSLFNHHYGFHNPEILAPTASKERRDSRDCEFDLNL